MEATRNLLNNKLLNNDVYIVTMIMDYLTEKCDCCNKKKFVEELDLINIPECFDEDCIKHSWMENKLYRQKYCLTCKEKHCCRECENVCCEDCNNLFHCDNKNCSNIFCCDCLDNWNSMKYCNSCEGKFCCSKIYRSIGIDGDVIYNCEDCIEVIEPRYPNY
jgi:hypothetical protein